MSIQGVVDAVCQECSGICCSKYPHYFQTLTGDILRAPITVTRGGLDASIRVIPEALGPEDKEFWDTNKYLPCYYYTQGGCNEAQKPDYCNNWLCKLLDLVVMGNEISPKEATLYPTWEFIQLYKMELKE